MEINSTIKKIWQIKKIEIIVLFYILSLLVIGLVIQPINELVSGLGAIFTASGILVTDYVVIGGLGPAFVNAAVVALIGYIILIINHVPFRGIAIATIFTMLGFALMGKTIWSILPIIFGVYIYSKLTKREFITNIYPALFGTALAPLVTHTAFHFGWGVIGGSFVGILIGLVIAPVANHALAFHEGYNLYNVGFSAGLVGMIFTNVIRAFGFEPEITASWGTEDHYFLGVLSLLLFISMIIFGILLSKERLKNFRRIIKEPGVTVTDFVNIAGFGNTLVNMGLVGLIGVAFILLIGSHFNGPTLCGLFTMVGFASFGKHPLNILPIMFGVCLGSFFSIYELNAPGTVLAVLFGTTLAPIAGRFGPFVGVLAGMIHLSLVSTIGFVHGGLNLYNNGFTGGFVASFLIAVRKGFRED